MDFAFSEEQRMLRGQARDWLADRFPADRVVELTDSESGWDPEAWAEMAALGWIGLSAPETLGGAGMSLVDEIVLFEELGRALTPGPYFSTVALCLPALEGVPELIAEAAAGRSVFAFGFAEPSGPYTLDETATVGTKAEHTNGSWTVSGEKVLVADLDAASHVVVTARAADGLGLFVVQNTGAASSTMDPSRRLGRIVLDGVDAQVAFEPGGADDVLARIRMRAHAALGAEAVGIAERVLEMAVEHSRTRTQFDKPIGAYQAVSHQIADTFMETELARSLAYWASWAVAEGDLVAAAAAAAAKAFAAESAVAACERSIQVHGGMGFTWEHMLHRYYKRAQWIEAFDGYPRVQRAGVATALLG